MSLFNLHTTRHCRLNSKPFSVFSSKKSHFNITRLQFLSSTTPARVGYKCCYSPNSTSVFEFSVPNKRRHEGEECGNGNDEFVDILKRFLVFVRSVLPGGSWWNLYEPAEVESVTMVPTTISVLLALRRLWALVANDKWVIFTGLTSLAIAAFSEISIPSLLAASIFAAQSGEAAVFYRNSWLLVFFCFVSGICSGLRGGCFGIVNVVLQLLPSIGHVNMTSPGASNNILQLKHLRERLYAALIFQDISFFDSETLGDLTSRLGADCQRLSHVIENNLHLILRNFLQGIGALIHLLTLSWPLALSTLMICSILSAIFLVYGRYQKMAARITQEFAACANDVTQETFSLMRTVRVYGTERSELVRYMQWLEKLAFISMRESVAYGFWNLSFNILYRSTQVFAVLLGGISILTGHVSPEQLTKYVLYCEWLIYAAWRLHDNLSLLFQSVGASDKVFQMMDFLPSGQFLSEGVKLYRLMGNIEFVNVSFSYPSRMTVPVLEHVSMSVQANEVVAIVGLSGSGKSTLANLLLRLYEPTNGQILIDGFPLRELDIKWLRSKIGFVGQEPRLFHMDIKSNISYGCFRDIKQEDVERAAKQAHAHEFILNHPNGYETVVDNDLLSGGQKQRIAIARAILRDPTILILDEATSALDTESEYYITGILHDFRNDVSTKRAVIVIAHRLSTVRAADRIMVMSGGTIVEMGNHKELLHQNGLYARLIKLSTDVLA